MRVARTATLILLLVAGCTTPAAEPAPSDSPATPSAAAPPSAATPSPPAAAMSITIRKSGGIAGVNDTLVVDAQGHWTRTSKTGGGKTGQLTPEQLAQAAKLATDPRLIAEAQTPPKTPANCADAFLYTVSVGSATVAYSDCSAGSPPPATTELVRYLDQVTGG